MIEIHTTYNRERFLKLCGMFDGDPRQGNPALYIRGHFDLRRICDDSGKRETATHLAVASVIIEGDSWVLPISVQHDGRILIDLETFIPDQSNFFSERVIQGLAEIGVLCKADGQTEYIIPIAHSRAEYYKSV